METHSGRSCDSILASRVAARFSQRWLPDSGTQSKHSSIRAASLVAVRWCRSVLPGICIVILFCLATSSGSHAQTFTSLYSFCPQIALNCPDGIFPNRLIQGSDGNLYGTTSGGGGVFPRQGTIFKMTLDGALTTLYVFCVQFECPDGSGPEAGLVQGTDGNFYGTTSGGGANLSGTVFKITPEGTLATLYSFCNDVDCADGADPVAGLIQASDGNFYGTTKGGGANRQGTVFKIAPEGTYYDFYTVLTARMDRNLLAGLVQGSDGNFYGTTNAGGGLKNCGLPTAAARSSQSPVRRYALTTALCVLSAVWMPGWRRSLNQVWCRAPTETSMVRRLAGGRMTLVRCSKSLPRWQA